MILKATIWRVVYRVENASKRGPYADWDADFLDDDVTVEHPRHGGYGIDPTRERRYGFSSRAQYLAWFNPRERRALRRQGFRLVRYRVAVDAVVSGNRQVLFYIDHGAVDGRPASTPGAVDEDTVSV